MHLPPILGMATSSNPMATLMALPVHRAKRWFDGTGQGSFWSSSNIFSKVKLHSLTGHKNLPMALALLYPPVFCWGW